MSISVVSIYYIVILNKCTSNIDILLSCRISGLRHNSVLQIWTSSAIWDVVQDLKHLHETADLTLSLEALYFSALVSEGKMLYTEES